MNQRTARTLLAVLLLGIYSTLYIARTITNFLRDSGVLRISVAVAFTLAGVAVIMMVLRNAELRKPRTLLLMLVAAGIYGAVVFPMESPEEKLHFIEYGTVGVLAFLSTPDSWREARRFLTAVIFTVCAGWVDEGIQALLPNRHYDLRDVGFNALAGTMALTVFIALRAFQRKTSAKNESISA
jgi:cell shape-determining protein MreD